MTSELGTGLILQEAESGIRSTEVVGVAGASRDPVMKQLEPFVGEWRLEAAFPDAPTGRVTFEWLPGERFLVERWEVPVPEAPDGIAMIGANAQGDGYLQHYFDSRGVARVYQMSFEDRDWKLWRDVADFSPLDFKQRFIGTLSGDGATITGRWEICHDGSTWEHDFELTYRRVT
jgi:hypothetical protein